MYIFVWNIQRVGDITLIIKLYCLIFQQFHCPYFSIVDQREREKRGGGVIVRKNNYRFGGNLRHNNLNVYVALLLGALFDLPVLPWNNKCNCI